MQCPYNKDILHFLQKSFHQYVSKPLISLLTANLFCNLKKRFRLFFDQENVHFHGEQVWTFSKGEEDMQNFVPK